MKMFGNTFRLVRILSLSAALLAPASFAWAQEEPATEHAAPAQENSVAAEEHGEPAAEHGGGAHHSMFTTGFVYSVINFALMVGLLMFLLRKPLSDFLLNRRDDVRKAIDEAHAAKQKAEKSLAEHRQKLASIEGELNTLRSEILNAGDRERDTILTAAKAQAGKIVDDARLMGEQEVRKAKAELREEMVKMASSLAEKTLRSSVSPQEREKQMNEFVSKLEAL